MFEAKTYNDIRKVLRYANCLFVLIFLILSYQYLLIDEHKKKTSDFILELKMNPFIGIVSISLLTSTILGYVSTDILRLHDRIYEPFLTKWRDAYDSDFILRSICWNFSNLVNKKMFEKAFHNKSFRDKAMSLLFYKYVGDYAKEHISELTRFYTIIRNYWLYVLIELYSYFSIIIFAMYSILFKKVSSSIYLFIIIFLGIGIFFRIIANLHLNNARNITSNQIDFILHDHYESFERDLTEFVKENNFKNE